MEIKKELLDLATQVFDNPIIAEKWLTEPTPGLGGAIPMEYAVTLAGLQEVKNLLIRIDNGIFI